MKNAFDNADAYDRFMGRYSARLAPAMADFAGVRGGQRVLDVGCGPGALLAELVGRVGPSSVAALDPSEAFVTAARERHPGVDVRVGSAESLPFADDMFDVAIAQLVVQFMSDPVAGLREMARVTRPEGAVAVCVWDAREGSPLATFWRAAREVDPAVEDETERPGTREGQLGELMEHAGLRDVESGSVETRLRHETFEDWWGPFELGVGPPGAYLRHADEERRAAIREAARSLLPTAPFTLTVRAWAARGRAK